MGRGGEGTLIFPYIRRLGPFVVVQNFKYQYFGGFQEKMIFLGWIYKYFVDIFGVITKMDLF